MPHTFSRSILVALLFTSALTSSGSSQRALRPEATLIQDVYVGRERDEAKKFSLLLRDGAIEKVLEAGTPPPPGVRVVDGRDLICLPAFLDAYSNTGCETPEPTKDQDVPVDVKSDVRIDMRLANRKGVQPSFRAVDALAMSKENSAAWREAGFGTALIAPEGELLSGTSVLVATGEAAVRDLVILPDVFGHAAFAANGPGYPSTLMGYLAQLRQFFNDSKYLDELERRHEQGRPGLRPPHDEELVAGGALLAKGQVLVCEAQSSRDMERWFKLADEFGLRIGFSGGLEAWRVADELSNRDVPVVLTLDWGKEVKDPLAKEEKKKDEAEEGEPEEKAAAEEAPDVEEEAVENEDAEEKADAEEDEDAEEEDEDAEEESVWEYTEPLGVRVEKRRRWEEKRDCAIRLTEAGVPFAFGTKGREPDKLLGDVRKLVEAGLSAEAALGALTTEAARLLGVSDRLGRIAAGHNATFCLWTDDPLTDEKAQALWVFVDGFPTEYERKKVKKKSSGEGPEEGLDLTGTWKVEFLDAEGIDEAKLVLVMDEQGDITGSIFVESPRDETEVEASIEGTLTGTEFLMDASLAFGEFAIDVSFSGTLEKKRLEGESTFSAPFMSEPSSNDFIATLQPEKVR
ncbi:MAG: hypothetical protein CMJ89_13940 [Planctomycetes bacterium]|jgi:imidazolonepropionase-like amidohydrolase|nr:hypothetical protein [Planctomycetota bacterium]